MSPSAGTAPSDPEPQPDSAPLSSGHLPPIPWVAKGRGQGGRAGLGVERPPRAGGHKFETGKCAGATREHHGCLVTPCHPTASCGKITVWLISKGARLLLANSALGLWPEGCSEQGRRAAVCSDAPTCSLSRGLREWEWLEAANPGDCGKPRWVRVTLGAGSLGSFRIPSPSKDGPGQTLASDCRNTPDLEGPIYSVPGLARDTQSPGGGPSPPPCSGGRAMRGICVVLSLICR